MKMKATAIILSLAAFLLFATTNTLLAGSSSYSQITGKDGKKMIMDEATGLTWQYEYKTDLTWKAAVAYCRELNYGGHTDWELPDRDKLVSLVDHAITNPASAFPSMPSSWFWSSSSSARYADGAWSVYFGDGYVGYDYWDGGLAARCVRP